jgi:CAAX prenyl protease-like protein
MGVEHYFGLPPQASYPIRSAVVVALLLALSQQVIPLRPTYPVVSALVGLGVFVLWIAPDLLFHYRGHWLFQNAITGKAASSIAPELTHNLAFLIIRTAGATFIVPIFEELFWRGWLMRWLISSDISKVPVGDFRKVPLGEYQPMAFWVTAVLFASEHGAYWEVGLLAGIIYNWWMVRTRNLADCIWAHAVTNGALSAYVIAAGQWQYWL